MQKLHAIRMQAKEGSWSKEQLRLAGPTIVQIGHPTEPQTRKAPRARIACVNIIPHLLRIEVREYQRVIAIVSAFIIASLAKETERRVEGAVPLSDQSPIEHTDLVRQRSKRWKHAREVSAFLRRLKSLEDEWRRETSADPHDDS